MDVDFRRLGSFGGMSLSQTGRLSGSGLGVTWIPAALEFGGQLLGANKAKQDAAKAKAKAKAAAAAAAAESARGSTMTRLALIGGVSVVGLGLIYAFSRKK